MARLVGLSEAHFIRAFRNTAGLPPHRFQLMLRIKAAKTLLLFRRIVGTTPMQWRRSAVAG